MEGVYSLSQLMGLVNHSFFDPAHRTSRFGHNIHNITFLSSDHLRSRPLSQTADADAELDYHYCIEH